jgi:hypothetical protein
MGDQGTSPGDPTFKTSSINDPKVSDIIKQAVDLGYQVINQQIAEGRKAAQLIRQGTYTAGAAEMDIAQLIQRILQLAKDLSVTGFDLVSAVVKDPRRAASPPSYAASSAAAPRMSQIAIEARSKKPVQVSCHWNPSAPHFVPFVRTLKSADRSVPPLTAVRFALTSDKQPMLVVEIPDEQPVGTYTGPIVDPISNEERGLVSIVIVK